MSAKRTLRNRLPWGSYSSTPWWSADPEEVSWCRVIHAIEDEPGLSWSDLEARFGMRQGWMERVYRRWTRFRDGKIAVPTIDPSAVLRSLRE